MKELKAFRIDTDVLDQVRDKAKKENRTVSNMVLTILKEWSEKEKRKAA